MEALQTSNASVVQQADSVVQVQPRSRRNGIFGLVLGVVLGIGLAYAYVAYRVGDGPNAEDVTSQTFERALRYRDSYDSRRGDPAAWLIGIARRCIADGTMRNETPTDELPELSGEGTRNRLRGVSSCAPPLLNLTTVSVSLLRFGTGRISARGRSASCST